MSDPLNTKRNQLPEPANSFRGNSNADGGVFRRVARLWRPKDAPQSEAETATVSRYSQRLIDRATGLAYDAAEYYTYIKATLKLYFDTLYMAVTGFDGVMVTKANGTRRCYVASADTDAARGLALEAAFAAAVAGDTIDLSPGNYLVAKSATNLSGLLVQYQILEGMTIRLNGARLYHSAAENTYIMFGAAIGTHVNDWSLLGPGILEGTVSTPTGSPSGEIGLNIAGLSGSSRRFRVSDITFRYFKNVGFQGNSPNYSGHGTSLNPILKISTGHVHGCNIDYNNVGLILTGSFEYITFSNCTFNNNLTNVDLTASNTKFIGCDSCGSTNYGVRHRDNSSQDGHGCWIGGHITHNVGFAIDVPANMNLGFIYSGVTFGSDNSTSNKIQSVGGGLLLANCYVESPFYASSTPTGLNKMIGCMIYGTYATVTDLSSAERLQWVFEDNHSQTGGWAQDDTVIYRFADDAAAATGGMTAGRKYTNSSTNAVTIKQ